MLLDTSGLLALHHKLEPLHEIAVEFYHSAPAILTHNYVLAEFIALADRRRLPRDKAIEIIRDLLAYPEISVTWVDRDLHVQALEFLMARRDKTYSLCDAVSFLLMRQSGITEALTTDHHFEQEGYRRLLT